MKDQNFCGLPWKTGGTSREGVDCRGLALLFAREEMGIDARAPESNEATLARLEELLTGERFDPCQLHRGDAVFFRSRLTGKIRHVAIYIGMENYLHIVNGGTSRIENGLTLLKRVGLEPVASISPKDFDRYAAALADPALGWFYVLYFVVSMGMSLAASYLQPKPSFGRYSSYGNFENLMTTSSTQVPLQELLGENFVAGNCVYQTAVDKTRTVDEDYDVKQKVTRIIVLGSGPVSEDDIVLRVDSLDHTNQHFFVSGALTGFAEAPAQTYTEAMKGDIGAANRRPNLTFYPGTHGITVPVDVRADRDRSYPVYGLAGCAYLVMRLINPAKFTAASILIRVRGRACRTFDTSGFISTTATAESLAGADGSKVRFKLANYDIGSVSSVTVGGTAYAEISAAAQTGNNYQLNRTKGFIEFITAPGAAAEILITYTYYPRAWTQNPASQLIYLLTDSAGKGFDQSRISWAAAVTLRDYCDEIVPGKVGGSARWKCDYVVDVTRPIQEHLRAVLDAAHATLFLSNGKFTVKARKADASVFSFSDSNIVADSFRADLVDRSDQPNRIVLKYHSADTLQTETSVAVDDESNQTARAARLGNSGVVEQSFSLTGVTTEDQAVRLAEMILQERCNARWMVALKTTVKGLALEPLDVVDVTHPSQPAWSGKLFRVEEIEHGEDDRLTLKCAEYNATAYS